MTNAGDRVVETLSAVYLALQCTWLKERERERDGSKREREREREREVFYILCPASSLMDVPIGCEP